MFNILFGKMVPIIINACKYYMSVSSLDRPALIAQTLSGGISPQVKI